MFTSFVSFTPFIFSLLFMNSLILKKVGFFVVWIFHFFLVHYLSFNLVYAVFILCSYFHFYVAIFSYSASEFCGLLRKIFFNSKLYVCVYTCPCFLILCFTYLYLNCLFVWNLSGVRNQNKHPALCFLKWLGNCKEPMTTLYDFISFLPIWNTALPYTSFSSVLNQFLNSNLFH